jgi:uncharacterized UBP type Zn finger protein
MPACPAADNAVQQDGQEFMKLLLTLLESKFGGQAGEVQGLIQALFRGQSGYRTVCQACQRESGKRGVALGGVEWGHWWWCPAALCCLI